LGLTKVKGRDADVSPHFLDFLSLKIQVTKWPWLPSNGFLNDPISLLPGTQAGRIPLAKVHLLAIPQLATLERSSLLEIESPLGTGTAQQVSDVLRLCKPRSGDNVPQASPFRRGQAIAKCLRRMGVVYKSQDPLVLEHILPRVHHIDVATANTLEKSTAAPGILPEHGRAAKQSMDDLRDPAIGKGRATMGIHCHMHQRGYCQLEIFETS